MQTKNRTAVVTEATAQAALRRGPAQELAPDEERALRMRLGAPPPRGRPLGAQGRRPERPRDRAARLGDRGAT